MDVKVSSERRGCHLCSVNAIWKHSVRAQIDSERLIQDDQHLCLPCVFCPVVNEFINLLQKCVLASRWCDPRSRFTWSCYLYLASNGQFLLCCSLRTCHFQTSQHGGRGPLGLFKVLHAARKAQCCRFHFRAKKTFAMVVISNWASDDKDQKFTPKQLYFLEFSTQLSQMVFLAGHSLNTGGRVKR